MLISSVHLAELLVEYGVRLVVAEKPEVRFIELIQFPPGLQRHRAKPVCLPAAVGHVPGRDGELHHVVHFEQPQQVLGVLGRRLQVADEVILDLAGVAQAVHLPPVLVEGHVLLRLRVQQVVNKVGEGGVYALREGLVRVCRGRGLVGEAPQDDLSEALVKLLVAQLKLIPVSRDEPHKRVAHEQELGVLLQLHICV